MTLSYATAAHRADRAGTVQPKAVWAFHTRCAFSVALGMGCQDHVRRSAACVFNVALAYCTPGCAGRLPRIQNLLRIFLDRVQDCERSYPVRLILSNGKAGVRCLLRTESASRP